MKLNVILEAIIGAATIVGTAVLAPILRSRSSRWGATDEEVRLAIPGDMLVPQPQSQLTMGVTVGATATVVWPWLRQLGCPRADWYSYDLLDNGGIPSAEHIIPDIQPLAVGDTAKATPQGDFGFPVVIIEANGN